MKGTRSEARRPVLAARLLDIAQLGYAHWLFGNIYEAVAKIPDRLADEAAGGEGGTSVLGPGSPVRYYAPVAPATLGSTAAAVR